VILGACTDVIQPACPQKNRALIGRSAMKFNRTIEKFELYILSLWFLFLLIIVVTIDIPVCFKDECKFIGLVELMARNVVPMVATLFVLLGVLY
jgi:hypothetical protein